MLDNWPLRLDQALDVTFGKLFPLGDVDPNVACLPRPD